MEITKKAVQERKQKQHAPCQGEITLRNMRVCIEQADTMFPSTADFA